MKKWNNPELQELEINATAYAPKGGYTKDGSYTSDDGKYNIPTFGFSTGNSGVPTVEVGDGN